MTFDLFCGKSEEKLKDFPDNHFDSCVCDGPYGIRFMGKAWDKFDIEKRAGIRKTAKSRDINSGRNGAHMSTAIEAGKYNQSNQSNQIFQQWTTELSREVYRVLKPGAYFLSFCSPRTFHRLVSGIEDAGFEIRDTIMWIFASGFPKSHNLKGDREGWGSALKPAYEPICMARKPLEGTIAQNVDKYGTGAINIDGSRIDGEPWTFGPQTDLKGGGYGTKRPADGHVLAKNVESNPLGRWPANFIHDGSEEVLNLMPESDGQMGDVKGTEPSHTGESGIFGNFGRTEFRGKRNDSGSAARFFYVPKTSRADRNEGCEHLKSKPLLWSSGTLNPGTFQSEGTDKSSPNNHPTVKPTELMQYLVRMVTPKGGLVLDHFCGSGSTGKACAIEGMNFVGIDQDPYNIEISRCRIDFINNNRDLFGTYNKQK